MSTVHDKRVDLQLFEARGDRQSGMSAANNQHVWIMVVICGRGFFAIEPVRPAKISRVRFAFRPRSLKLFRLERVAIAGIGCEPEDAAAAALGGFETKDGLDRSVPAAPQAEAQFDRNRC